MIAAPLPTVAKLRARGDSTVPARRLSRDELRVAAILTYPSDVAKPLTRGDCERAERPCPFVSCAHHLYLDVNQDSGSIKFNFPEREPEELAETCSLDVADRGGITLEEVGAIINLTRERVRQVETVALAGARLAVDEDARP